MESGERLRACEYHLFTIAGRRLLFDVNALTTAASSVADAAILERASGGASVSELTRAARAAGASPRQADARVRELRAMRFLQSPGERSRRAKAVPETDYATFMVNVSQRCNLTCTYCYVNRGRFDYETMPLGRMPAATASRLVARIHECFPRFRTYAYHFYGGEPLLSLDAIRRIVDAAERAAKASDTETDFHITTNGTLITPGVADFFDRHHFTVYVSIDGDRANHDRHRRYASGRGSFDDVERNLRHLRGKRNVHIIGSAVIRQGLALGDAIALLRSHGADQCKAERVHLLETDPLTLNEEEHRRYLHDIEQLVSHYVDALSAGKKPMDFRLSSRILQLLVKQRRSSFCAAASRMFGIAANGEIYPCALHVGRANSLLGDIDSGVDDARQNAFRARFDTSRRPDCRRCWSRHLCGGGCPAMVDRFGGVDCRVIHAESEAAIAVYQQMIESEPVLLYALVSPSLAQWAAFGEAS